MPLDEALSADDPAEEVHVHEQARPPIQTVVMADAGRVPTDADHRCLEAELGERGQGLREVGAIHEEVEVLLRGGGLGKVDVALPVAVGNPTMLEGLGQPFDQSQRPRLGPFGAFSPAGGVARASFHLPGLAQARADQPGGLDHEGASDSRPLRNREPLAVHDEQPLGHGRLQP